MAMQKGDAHRFPSSLMKGRRPFDYLTHLPAFRQKRLLDHVKSRFGYFANERIAEDCCQEAFLQILKYPHDLENGPQPISTVSTEWDDIAERALKVFCNNEILRKATIRIAHGRTRPREIATDQEDMVNAIDSQCDDYNVGSATTWNEDRQHWQTGCKVFRDFLLTQPDVDILEVQLFDTLEKRSASEMFDSKLEDGIRGETFQIIHTVLLPLLCESFPDSDWSIEKLKTITAKLRRHARNHGSVFLRESPQPKRKRL